MIATTCISTIIGARGNPVKPVIEPVPSNWAIGIAPPPPGSVCTRRPAHLPRPHIQMPHVHPPVRQHDLPRFGILPLRPPGGTLSIGLDPTVVSPAAKSLPAWFGG